MAGLYLVAAWLIAQVGSLVLTAFDVPSWVLRAILIALAIGFIPALVFAWVFELTPDGFKRGGEVPADESIAPQTAKRMNRALGVLLAIAVTYFAVDKLVLAPQRDADLVTQTTEQVVARVAADKSKAAANSIAVLPFVNMSADKDNEYFSDGISEELLNVLVRVNGLDVASRTSSFAYKGRELGTRQIAEELGVSYLLEGSVRKSGDKVRITAQLIDARNDRHLWSDTYDRDLTDIFVIQDEIANAIVTALRSELASEGKPLAPVKVQADTDNLTAYDTYLKARELFIARSDLPEATRLFERVVELDPRFARGWEGLAATYSILESWGIDDRDYTSLAKTAAQRALRIDSALSMPWAVLAMANTKQPPYDWSQILQDFDKAIAADPHNATARLWRGIMRTHLGYFDEAGADFRRCLQIDPAYRNCVRWQARIATLVGDDDRALALLEQVVATGFIGNLPLDFVPLLHAHGDRIGARLMLRETFSDSALAKQMIMALDRPGWRPDNLEAILAEAKPHTSGTIRGGREGNNWLMLLWFGEFDRVADTTTPDSDSQIAWQRFPTGWIGSPQWKRMLRKLGFVDHWRRAGFPAHCRALGKDDFTCNVPRAVRLPQGPAHLKKER